MRGMRLYLCLVTLELSLFGCSRSGHSPQPEGPVGMPPGTIVVESPSLYFADEQQTFPGGTLPAGTLLTILRRSGNAAEVRWEGGRGWVPLEVLQQARRMHLPADPSKVQKIPTH